MNVINGYYGRLIQEFSADEFKHIERIAGILSENKQIRNNSVGSLARAFCFVKVNEFLQIEQTQAAWRTWRGLKIAQCSTTRTWVSVMNDHKLEWLTKRVEHLEERLTRIERLLMREGRELFSDTATHITQWTDKDVWRARKIKRRKVAPIWKARQKDDEGAF
jgi:hypothetical protein